MDIAKIFEFFANWIQEIVAMFTHIQEWIAKAFKPDDTTDDTDDTTT